MSFPSISCRSFEMKLKWCVSGRSPQGLTETLTYTLLHFLLLQCCVRSIWAIWAELAKWPSPYNLTWRPYLLHFTAVNFSNLNLIMDIFISVNVVLDQCWWNILIFQFQFAQCETRACLVKRNSNILPGIEERNTYWVFHFLICFCLWLCDKQIKNIYYFSGHLIQTGSFPRVHLIISNDTLIFHGTEAGSRWLRASGINVSNWGFWPWGGSWRTWRKPTQSHGVRTYTLQTVKYLFEPVFKQEAFRLWSNNT